MSNLKRVENALRYIADCRCREVVVCAGARNAPLVVALNSQTHMKVWSLFEERSAGFFALGRIKATGCPVAVVTTSGTAAAELMPAAIEGHYAGMPLLLVTADRPPGYRGTGAPQAIEQVGLFGSYVEAGLDLWNEPATHSWGGRRPLHLNICLEEPGRGELQEIENLFAKWDGIEAPAAVQPMHTKDHAADQSVQRAKADFVARSKSPAVVVSGLAKPERELVKSWLRQVQAPVFFETPSGLSSDQEMSAFSIGGGERSLEHGLSRGWVDGIIRIGGVPTLRLWRDLESKHKSVPVISFSARGFTGLSRADSHCLELAELKHFQPPSKPADPAWTSLQAAAGDRLQSLLLQYPTSEHGMLFALAKQMNAHANVYVGNSLPIREWDLVAPLVSNNWNVEANRGANGIDGQLSTFFGFADPDKENWSIVGDLTAMYDLSAPFILRQRPVANCNIVVINNRGGQIFSRMYSRIELENRHDVEFPHWAAMWGLDYERWAAVPANAKTGRPRVIELAPADEATAAFLQAWEATWLVLSRR